MTMPPVYHLLLSSDAQQKIFIIGDSTVHIFSSPYLLNVKHMTCGADNPENLLQGWGDSLGRYAGHPGNVINRARAGSSSVTYRTEEHYDVDKYGVDRYWRHTRALMEAAGSGFLLIQFGTGNENNHAPVQDYDGDGDTDGDDEVLRRAARKAHFDAAIAGYISEARTLGFTPILITPPDGRFDGEDAPADGTHPPTRGPFPGYIHDLGVAHGVEVIDLNARSNMEFAKYSDMTLRSAFGDCTYHNAAGDATYMDRVHYEPQGADKIAGWVKELACSELNDQSLCAQFSPPVDKVIPNLSLIGSYFLTLTQGEAFVDPGATAHDDVNGNITGNIVVTDNINNQVDGTYHVTYNVSDLSGNPAIPLTRAVTVSSGVVVHEDAEDGNTEGWGTYGTPGTITNVADHGGRAIDLHGDAGLDNGFRFPDLNITSGFVASWSLRYSEAFRFFAIVRTVNSPDANIYMEYVPSDISTGLDGSYIRNGLGADANDGTWHTFTRDLEADLHVAYPDDSITMVTGFAIRGSGRIDDITTSTRGPAATFTYGGHNYEIVKTARSWEEAQTAAHHAGGYLANIGSIAENHEIYSRLYRYIEADEYANTVASNGGGASYVWIGGNDADAEGTWIWEDNADQFWSGNRNGHSTNGLYNNWGRDTDEIQHEPDDAGNQDAAGIALTRWPVANGVLGQTSQWNDLKAGDELYYIIESN